MALGLQEYWEEAYKQLGEINPYERVSNNRIEELSEKVVWNKSARKKGEEFWKKILFII